MKGTYYKEYVAELKKEPNDIPRGLKSKLVKSLLNHSRELCGQVTREKGVLRGVSKEPVLYIKVVVGNPEIKSDWNMICSIIKTIFEPCEVIGDKTKLPPTDSILRKQLHVGETSVEARRTRLCVASSGDSINEETKCRIDFDECSSSSGTFKLVGDSDEERFIGESVSEVSIRNQPKKLRRIIDTIRIKSFEYDTTDCTIWSEESIKTILLTPRKQGGIGFTEKKIVNIDIDGTNFENIIDALLRFNGDEEEKIGHATKNLDKNLNNHATSESIVRWVFRNLLEYSKRV